MADNKQKNEPKKEEQKNEPKKEEQKDEPKKEDSESMTVANSFMMGGKPYHKGQPISVPKGRKEEFINHGYVVDPDAKNKKAEVPGAK